MGKRILIVEDNEALATMMVNALTDSGFEATSCLGIAAIMFMDVGTWMPDVVLLDMRMPPPNGVDVARQMRANPETASIPICVISAWDAQMQAESIGAQGYLDKPFSVEELLAAVERLVAHAEMGSSNAP